MSLPLLPLLLISLLSVVAGKEHEVSTATNTSHVCACPSLSGPQGLSSPLEEMGGTGGMARTDETAAQLERDKSLELDWRRFERLFD